MAHIISLFFVPLLMLAGCAQTPSSPSNSPRIQAGILDLKNWNSDGNTLRLDGDWFFRWGEFTEPGSIPETRTFLHVPDFWNGKQIGDLRLTPEGYGTYHLKILRKPTREILAIRVIDMESAYDLYANGTLIGSNGKIGKSRETEIAEWKPQIYTFVSDGDVDLVLHVSNFHHRLGGIWQGFHFGKQEAIQGIQTRALALELFMAGSFLMISIYHLLIFIVRRTETEFLLLAIFCIIMGIRILVTGERFLLTMFPSMEWITLVRLDYLTVSVGLIVCHWYLKNVFRGFYSNYMFIGMLVVIGPCVVAELFLDVKIFSHLTPVHSVSVFIWSIYFLVVNAIAMFRRMPGSIALFAGWIIAVVGTLNDALYVQSFVSSGYTFAIGLQAFILTQSYYLATRYARAFSLSELLAKRMESLLALTRELNRSGARDSAIWTAANEIQKLIGTDVTPSAYVLLRDTHIFQKLAINGDPEPVSLDLSNAFYSLEKISNSPSGIRIPIRNSTETLCVIELPGNDRVNPDANQLPEIAYMDGILDSLALVLENIDRVQQGALAAIGQAASEIVHDINHHCQIISHYSQTAQNSKNPGESLQEIDRATVFMKNLALDILDYAREKLIVHPQARALDEVVDSIRTDLTDLFRETSIDCSVEQFSDRKVYVDLDRFRRVVLNLARNAAGALGDSGHFSVKVDYQQDVCCFVFEDDGPGLDESLRDRLFEPFASGGRGSGLGLAVVKRIVVAHGGQVQVSSESGKGCRFLVELPAA